MIKKQKYLGLARRKSFNPIIIFETFLRYDNIAIYEIYKTIIYKGKKMPTPCSELDILIALGAWLVKNGWELEAISIAKGAGLPPIEVQKEQVKQSFKSMNIRFTKELFQSRGPDIVAHSKEGIWKIECKGLGKGRSQTLRNNFDRAVASAMSYLDAPDTRIGLALANDYLWALDFGQRLPRYLREATNLWVFLLDNRTIYPYQPTEDLPYPGADM